MIDSVNGSSMVYLCSAGGTSPLDANSQNYSAIKTPVKKGRGSLLYSLYVKMLLRIGAQSAPARPAIDACCLVRYLAYR